MFLFPVATQRAGRNGESFMTERLGESVEATTAARTFGASLHNVTIIATRSIREKMVAGDVGSEEKNAINSLAAHTNDCLGPITRYPQNVKVNIGRSLSK